MVSFLSSCKSKFSKSKPSKSQYKPSPSLPDLPKNFNDDLNLSDEFAKRFNFSRQSFIEQTPSNDYNRRLSDLNFKNTRRKKIKRRLNVLVVGRPKTGKTSLLRLILDTVNVISPSNVSKRTESLIAFTNKHEPKQPLYSLSFDIGDNSNDKTLLTLTDSPGLDFDNESKLNSTTNSILNHVENLYSDTLDQEFKVNRNLILNSFDNLIHVCIYLIDPKKLIRNSSGTLSLSQTEISIIIKLSRRLNVLPVLSHSDSLTDHDLKVIKDNILTDLSNISFKFEQFGISDEDATNTPDENVDDINNVNDGTKIIKVRHKLKSSTPSIQSSLDNSLTTNIDPVPYAIVIPERFDKPSTTRKFRWGTVDVMNEQHTDFKSLHNTLFGNNADFLRTRTKQVLYENYRREALIDRQNGNDTLNITSNSIRNGELYKKRQQLSLNTRTNYY